MIYGYLRVSTSTQQVENQKHKISNYANKNNLKIEV
jgi:DNA invertase Pin-like site-specific DNA recombinase